MRNVRVTELEPGEVLASGIGEGKRTVVAVARSRRLPHYYIVVFVRRLHGKKSIDRMAIPRINTVRVMDKDD